MSDWKRTGQPAHNNAVERSAEDNHDYLPNPSCVACAGSGEVVMEQPVRNYEGECVDVEFYNHPCDCIFQKWVAKPDKTCPQCKGTGAVQERLMEPLTKEEYIMFHDCICLRFVKEMITDE